MTELNLVIIRCARLAMKDNSACLNPRDTKNTDYGLRKMALRTEWRKVRSQLVFTVRNSKENFADLPAAGIDEGGV
jgi:hypothetical protein